MEGSSKQDQAWVEFSALSDQSGPPAQGGSASRPGVALLQLPQRYWRALTKPSLATYTSLEGQASWSLVGVQLIIWAILDAALGVLVNLISPPVISSSFSRFYSLATSYGLVLVVPALFFVVMGVVYLCARFFKGQGTFLEQCNVFLYVGVPLGIGSKLLALIPGVGRYLNIVLSLYGIVLLVLVIVAVHRPSKSGQ